MGKIGFVMFMEKDILVIKMQDKNLGKSYLAV